jgi:hypothetical protein
MTRGEILVRSIFEQRYDLKTIRIPPDEASSADYFLYRGQERIASCEIKDIEYVEPSEQTGWKRDSRTKFWSRPDNAPQRIRKKIYEGYRQLRRYDLPKVLVLVNFTTGCDVADLDQAISGYLPYRDAEGNVRLVADKGRGSLGRVQKIMREIDLYIWLDQVRKSDIELRAFEGNVNIQKLLTYFREESR